MGRHGKKGIFKDPTVHTSTALYRMMFSRTTGGVVTSAMAVRWLAPYIQSTASPLLMQVVQKKWQAMVGSAVVGFGLGYSLVCSLNWARLRAIAALLDYKGWMFNQKAMSTKVSEHQKSVSLRCSVL